MNVSSLVDRYGARALILGGTEGIGAEFAELLTRAGLNLTLVARSAGALNQTADRVRRTHAVDVIELDLSSPDARSKAEGIVAAHDFGLLL